MNADDRTSADSSKVDRSVSIEEFASKRGEIVGRSGWLTIDQAMVDRFADVTRDRQFIHVDPVRAEATAFGGTITHGFFILSLLSTLYEEAVPPLRGAEVGINFGFDRVRFVSPVKTGSRIRATFSLARFEEQKPGHWRTLFNVTVETGDGSTTAMVADWLILWVF